MKWIYKFLKLRIRSNFVSIEDIMHSYDSVSSTYQVWLDVMGKYTLDLLTTYKSNENILDLCSGTGFISNNILNINENVNITAVDISSNMLSQIRNKKITLINQDGIAFLKSTKDIYDKIYIGYALPYIETNEIYGLIKNRLTNQGTFAFITNIRGTLKNSYRLIFEIAKKYPDRVSKVLDVKLYDKNYYVSKLKRNGFTIEKIKINNETISFKDKDKFINWMLTTGAFAGIEYIFNDLDIKDEINKLVDKYYLKDSVYSINHKVMAVVSRKGE